QEVIASLYLQTGRYDDALRHSKVALNLHPAYRKARRVFAEALRRRAASAEIAPALPDFVFDDGAGDAFAHEEIAEIAFARGDRDAALEQVRAALAREPDSLRALWQLGILLRDRGDHAGAAEAFRRITALAPDSNEARDALERSERALAEERTMDRP